MKSILALGLLASVPALANDGFYQGSGYHLSPVKSQDLRVVSETLEIRPIEPVSCYAVTYKGKAIRSSRQFENAGADKNGFKLATKKSACPGSEKLSHALATPWTAVAHYEVTALRDAKDVLIGFPVPQWEFEYTTNDGLDDVTLAGAVNFKTSINGKSIRSFEVKGLKITVPALSLADGKPFEEPGYTWKASFEAGKKYSLLTSYDFGGDISSGYYEGREYPKGQLPWFGTTLPAEVEHLYYYLTPIRTWAQPAPEKVTVRILAPSAIPIPYLIPVDAKPSCVDEKGYVYSYTNAFPDHDINISYPDPAIDPKALRPIKSEKEWSDWIKAIGNGTTPVVACALRARLAQVADPSAQAAISATPCLESCEK